MFGEKKQQIISKRKIGPNQQVDYDEKDILGSGAFGTVYGGIIYKDVNQRVAVKQLRYKGKMLERKCPNFEREINILATLSHRFIIKFYFCYVDPKTDEIFIVTERCLANDLSKEIKNSSKLSYQRSFQYAHQLVQAMAYMHEKGIMHRDLKPQNILLTSQGNLKIADLGLAKSILKDKVQSLAEHTLSGTPIYASPQIIKQQFYSAKCDVWSAGCLLYEMLTGEKLFIKGNTILTLRKIQKQFQQKQKKLKYFSEIDDPFLKKILELMLTFDDQQRPSFQYLLQLFEDEKKRKQKSNRMSIQYQTPSPQMKKKQTEPELKSQIKMKILRMPRKVENKPIEEQIKPIYNPQQKPKIQNPQNFTTKKQTDKADQKNNHTGSKVIKIGKIRYLNQINSPDTETDILLNQNQKIEEYQRMYDQAYALMVFKYEKIKTTYKYMYQFQTTRTYPLDSCTYSVLSFFMLLWYKMEVMEFIRQFKVDEYIIYGKKITFQPNLANKKFLNRRQILLNETKEKLQKIDPYIKQTCEFLSKDKYKYQLMQLNKIYGKLNSLISNYKTIELPSQQVTNIFKNFLRQVGMPQAKIEQLAQEQKLKIYRLIASLLLLCEKEKKYSNQLLKGNKYSEAGIKDQMTKEFEDISRMSYHQVMAKIQ